MNLVDSQKDLLAEAIQADSERSHLCAVCMLAVLYVLPSFSIILCTLQANTGKQMAHARDIAQQIINLLATKPAQSANDIDIKIDRLKETTALKMEKLDDLKKKNADVKHPPQYIQMLQQTIGTDAKQPSQEEKTAQEKKPSQEEYRTIVDFLW